MTRSHPQLKPITREGVAAALLKGHRYRVLNDSIAAESICLDVLAIDPENVEALVMHVLAITDQFTAGHAEDLARAGAAVARLTDPYKHAYYHGVIAERWAKSVLHRAVPRAAEMAYDWIEKALVWYAKAENSRPAGNDEAILRWNTCVRMLQRDPHLKPREAEAWEPSLE
jgi:hypothetical protein